MEWQPIATAPKDTELLVCRFVNDRWIIGQAGLYYDSGSLEEPNYWYWANDNCQDSLVEDEGPSHWQPLPPTPTTSEE